MLRLAASVVVAAALMGSSARADSVQGSGEYYPPTCAEPCEGFHRFSVSASSGPNGENPTGSLAWYGPGPFGGGPVTKLCVSGNTAVIVGGAPEPSMYYDYYRAIVVDNAGLGEPDSVSYVYGDVPFTSCDPAADEHAVSGDGYSITSGDFVVVDTSPLTPAQQLDVDVPCAGPKGTTAAWKNHGQYMRAVAQTVNQMIVDQIVTEDAGDALVSDRAASACGR